MSQRLTNILGYATLIAILAAIWVLFGEDPSREQGARGENTFVGLADVINDIAVIHVGNESEHTSLVRDEAGVWRIEERAGFPADAEKVRQFLRGIALSKRRDPKTSNPGKFERLGLDAESAIKIDLRTSDGKTQAAFRMGERNAFPAGDSLTYIFQPSDTRAWLVTGLMEAPTSPASWLEKKAITINRERVEAVTLGGVVISRRLDEASFSLQDIPDGREAASGFALGEPATILTSLLFEDVRKINNPIQSPVQTIEMRTHDGLKMTFDLFEMDGGVWVKASALYDTAAAEKGDAGTLPEAPADGAGEAESLNGWLKGWIFRLSARDAELLMQQKADFLKPQTPQS